MSAYTVSEISAKDTRAQRQVDALLAREGLTRESNVDWTIGVFDADYRLVATGSAYGNTLRCVAVDGAVQGQGLLATLLTALIERMTARGHYALFLYTKPETARYFSELGFYEIARVENRIVFMENQRGAFSRYLKDLSAFKDESVSTAAVVMNANPFTLGHRYLLERASAENGAVRCFVVSEDISLVPFADRLALVKAGASHLPNVTIHPSGSYLISSATFPAYFLKAGEEVTRTQAKLDIAVFAKIAAAMGISRRYFGEEPFSQITGLYNDEMMEGLPRYGIGYVLVPRVQQEGEAVSASRVRLLLREKGIEAIRPYVPESTYAFFQTEAGERAIAAMRAAESVWHD